MYCNIGEWKYGPLFEGVKLEITESGPDSSVRAFWERSKSRYNLLLTI